MPKPVSTLSLILNFRQEYLSILQRLEKLEMDQAQQLEAMAAVEAKLESVGTKLTKIGGETQSLLEAIADLRDQLAAMGSVSPEVEAAMQRLADKAESLNVLATAVDDKVDDSGVVG